MIRPILVFLPAALLLAAAPLPSPAAAQAAVVRGTVWDSTRAAPLEGADVYLSGTASTARTGPDGRFVLEAPGEGRYLLAFSHPGLGPLAAAARSDTVSLSAGDTVTATLAVPGWRTLAPLLCPDSVMRNEAGIVLGRVSGPGAPAATVTASWFTKGYSTRSPSFTRGDLTTRADDEGFYVLCGVSSQAELTVRAEAPPARGQAEARVRNGRPARADIVLREGPS